MKTNCQCRKSSFRYSRILIICALLGILASANAQNAVDKNAMLNAVNSERTSRGLSALSWNFLLESAALRHTSDMSSNGFLSHTGSDGSTAQTRIDATGYQWSAYGENVAQGQTSVTEVMTAWMNSAGHRANILNSNFMEIGVARVGNYWTQVFARPSSGVPGQGGNPSDNWSAYYQAASDYYNYYKSINQHYVANFYYYDYYSIGLYYYYSALGREAQSYYSRYEGLSLAYYYLYLYYGQNSTANYYYYYYRGYALYLWYSKNGNINKANKDFYYHLAIASYYYYTGQGNSSSANYYYSLYMGYSNSY